MKESIEKSLKDRDNETVQLENTLSGLKTQVASRKIIKQSRDTARGIGKIDPVELAATKMKKVVSRKHLVDMAKSQAEEIEYLQQELDKLRQRTFPSFVNAAKKRVSLL